MIQVNMHPTESEKKGHEKRMRLPKAEQARLRSIVSSAGESRESEPTVGFYGFLVPALG